MTNQDQAAAAVAEEFAAEVPAAEAPPVIASPAELAKLTASAVGASQDAATKLRTLGDAVMDMAIGFKASCEKEAVTIEKAAEQYSNNATKFALAVFAQATQVSTIQDAIADIKPRPRVEQTFDNLTIRENRVESGQRVDIARDLDVPQRPLPKFMQRGPFGK